MNTNPTPENPFEPTRENLIAIVEAVLGSEAWNLDVNTGMLDIWFRNHDALVQVVALREAADWLAKHTDDPDALGSPVRALRTYAKNREASTRATPAPGPRG